MDVYFTTAWGSLYSCNDRQCRSTSPLNNPRVNPRISFGTAVVIALIDAPDGPKLMVEAMLNM